MMSGDIRVGDEWGERGRHERAQCGLSEYAPLHVLEGGFTPWELWFAWRPVRTEQARLVWLRRTWRRWFYPAAWFINPAPVRWRQYSDIRRSYWELTTAPASEGGGT